MSHVKKIIRVNEYSNPPAHGGLVAKIVLGDKSLRELWINEISYYEKSNKRYEKYFC